MVSTAINCTPPTFSQTSSLSGLSLTDLTWLASQPRLWLWLYSTEVAGTYLHMWILGHLEQIQVLVLAQEGLYCLNNVPSLCYKTSSSWDRYLPKHWASCLSACNPKATKQYSYQNTCFHSKVGFCWQDELSIWLLKSDLLYINFFFKPYEFCLYNRIYTTPLCIQMTWLSILNTSCNNIVLCLYHPTLVFGSIVFLIEQHPVSHYTEWVFS